jgi:hypothetical protein
MNKFVAAAKTGGVARTTNGMKAQKSTGSKAVDFFFQAGAMRGRSSDLLAKFAGAYGEDREIALRLAQWLRDVRGGAGERKSFRDIMAWLETNHPEDAKKLLAKVPVVGRWDDIFVVQSEDLKKEAYTMLGNALRARDGLAAKWTPRKGPVAVEVRKFFGMSPKFYRKSLVELSSTVEQLMCAREWDQINFSHVPSVAAARYKKAFWKQQPDRYKTYVEDLKKGVDKDGNVVKINANAIFPYDVLKEVLNDSSYGWNSKQLSAVELGAIEAQWNALPNYVGDANIMPIIDVSGSMTWVTLPGSSLQPMHIAQGLGLYIADKNKGAFNGMVMTFDFCPELVHLTGNIIDKIQQMKRMKVGGSTNLHAAIDKLLEVAVAANAPAEDMPKMLLVFSDMQFNICTQFDHTAMQMIEAKYKAAGYEVPQVVFWNLNARDNVPVSADKSGAALVSGFSPSLVKSLLAADLDEFSPEGIMLKTIMVDKYDI